MHFPGLLLIVLALLLVGILVVLQLRTGKPPAGAQLLADLWKQLPREQLRNTATTPLPSTPANKPPGQQPSPRPAQPRAAGDSARPSSADTA